MSSSSEEEPLSVRHAHPRDSQVTFSEEGHRYTVAGQDHMTSVTTLIKRFFEEFNLGKAIMMVQNKKEYAGKTPDEIAAGWEVNRDEAARDGTEMHRKIEQYYETGLVPPEGDQSAEWSHFLCFDADIRIGRSPYRTEWTLWTDRETQLCGSIDFVAVNEAQTERSEGRELCVEIIDWKRSKKIVRPDQRCFGTGRGPCRHLPCCNHIHYNLQQDMYAEILEQYYADQGPFEWRGRSYQRLRVLGTSLVVMHPKDNSYTKYLLKPLREEVRLMLEWRRWEVRRLLCGEPSPSPHDLAPGSAEPPMRVFHAPNTSGTSAPPNSPRLQPAAKRRKTSSSATPQQLAALIGKMTSSSSTK